MVEIDIINDYGKSLSFKKNLIYSLVTHLFNDQKTSIIKLNIILSNKVLLNKMKIDYFNVNQYTDVIAFNFSDKNKPIDGEIYISIDDVQENAIEFKQTFNNEFIRVLIHGLLHLIGYKDDNNINKKNMRNLEDKYLTLNKVTIISLSNK